ncbi:hypothetical protein [Kineococcus aurantiacus]|uniref:Uncharacterized protein n=1 Tax=Kineococcus aurantiacus TaxID=37633 RepID=A0A7Y9DPM2_9ACTN|nr:hypothetical protein [Kineococcus aurantiacus]NYD24477.1 hypothetical protein [Kineococcus aurantiacus]
MSTLPPLPGRSRRYVPRHSTREPFRAWDGQGIAGTTPGATPAHVLESLLTGLGTLDRPGADPTR